MKKLTYFNITYFNVTKVTLKRGTSYIASKDWVNNKKSTINPHNINDNNCFLCSIVTALNYQSIPSNPKRISNLKPFISGYNWNDIEFPAGHKDYSAFEKNNTGIALNILYIPHNTFEIRPCYISKHNKTRNIQANLLMITDGKENWHYLARKSISALLRGITSSHNGDFCCLNCFHSYRTLNALKNHEKVCEDHDYCNVKMPDDDYKYISGTSCKNSLRVPIVIYADFECLLFKIDSCENCPDNSYTEKKSRHMLCGYSLTTCYSCDKTLNKCLYYRGIDCAEKFSQDLKEIFNKRIYFEEKSIFPLTDGEKVLYDNEKLCSIYEKEFCIDKKVKITKIIVKLETIVFLPVNIMVLLILYAI